MFYRSMHCPWNEKATIYNKYLLDSCAVVSCQLSASCSEFEAGQALRVGRLVMAEDTSLPMIDIMLISRPGRCKKISIVCRGKCAWTTNTTLSTAMRCAWCTTASHRRSASSAV